MSVYEDDVMKRLHELVADGRNVRHAIALVICEFGEKITVWAETVKEREIEGES